MLSQIIAIFDIKYKVMKKLAVLSLLILSFSASYSQRIISKTYLMTLTTTQMDSLLNANGISIVEAIINIQYDIDVYRLDYNTVAADSTPIMASGMMAVPRNTTCKFPMMMYEHGTETAKLEAPSYLSGQEPVIGMVVASTGYVVSEPDYLGLGDGPGLSPYQHAQTEASASIDMLRSVREYCDSAGIGRNGQLFLMGYSQGGHACMATHRAIQNQLNGEFNVTASVCMSGAYDMSGTMINRMLSDTPYSQPGYLADLVISLNPIYHFYDSIQQVFIAPYDTTVPPLLDGTHGVNDINNVMPSVAKQAFTQTELDTFMLDTNSVFRKALEANDVYDWLPQCPMRIYFCMADQYVPYMNSVVAINRLRQNGCTTCDTMDIDPTLNHVPCAQPSIINAVQYFNTMAHIDSCNPPVLGINSMVNNASVNVYPNPAKDILNIEAYFSDQTLSAAMYDIDGRQILQAPLNNGLNAISLNNISPGVYILKVTDSNGASRIRKVTVE
jgi:pimeloyl-ACP methyl ester carboxylesterase